MTTGLAFDVHRKVAAVLTALGASDGVDTVLRGAMAPVVRRAEARATGAAMGWRVAHAG